MSSGFFHRWIVLLGVMTGAPLAPAWGGTLLIPTDPLSKRPPSDLVYEGRRIDVSEATRLAQQGIPLDTLDPEENVLFTQARLPRIAPEVNRFPSEGASVLFHSTLASTRGLFRFSVDDSNGRAYTMTAALHSPAAVIRASLLRLMGYPVSNPKLYRRINLRFSSITERDQFVEQLSDRTLTSRNRWIAHQPESDPVLTLQGMVLERGRIQVQPVHWGLITQASQRDRRVFRALLLPFILADLPEKTNQFAWHTGRRFSESIWLEYLHSDAFSDVTLADLKWAARRIARISRQDLALSVADAKLPPDVTALITERLISRRNGLLSLFSLESEFLNIQVNEQISTGNVRAGQLTRHDYEGFPQDFYERPELPPLRFSQVWRKFLVEGLSFGIGEGLRQINANLLTLENESTAVARHQEDVRKRVARYLYQTGGLDGFEQTTGIWARPLFGININASRSVVAGTLLGSDSQVQMVDSLSADASAGVYLGFDGIQNVVPGIAANVYLGRAFTHIRPITTVHSALTTHWGRLAVSSFMENLGRSLDPNIECTIPEAPHRVDFEIDGVSYIRVRYDQNRTNAIEEARKFRDELVRAGEDPEKIVLLSIDRAEECQTEVDAAIKENLGSFMEGLAVGESFVITDYIRFGAGISANFFIPVAEIVGVSIGTRANKNYQITRSTILRKTENGFQVYLQDRKVDDHSFGIDINLYLRIVSLTRTERHGKGNTEFFQIITENATTETRRNLIRSVQGLLLANSSEILFDHFHPYSIHQDTRASITRFKFLAWSRDHLSQDHEVNIYPPFDPNGSYNREERKRTLHMKREVARDGQDLFSFGVEVLGSLTGGAGASLAAAGAVDPGNSIGGSSSMMAVSVQGEVTPGYELRPVGMVEQVYRGWSAPKSRVFGFFDTIERVLEPIRERRPLFRRELFQSMARLQLYQIETILVIYPDGLQQLADALLRPRSHREAFTWLIDRYGWDRLRLVCDMRDHLSPRMPNIWYRDWTGRICSPAWVTELMRIRQRGLRADPRQRLGDYQKIFKILISNLGAGKTLETVDPRHYFLLTRVNGFRKGDFSPQSEYVSDTLGRYDNEIGLGIYRDIAAQMGISAFEIYGRFFTDSL